MIGATYSYQLYFFWSSSVFRSNAEEQAGEEEVDQPFVLRVQVRPRHVHLKMGPDPSCK